MIEQSAVPTAAVAAAVKTFVLEQFLAGVPASELTETTPLVTGGILDSLATVQLITFLEEQYGIEILPHETSAEYIDTLHEIARLVTAKLEARGHGAG